MTRSIKKLAVFTLLGAGALLGSNVSISSQKPAKPKTSRANVELPAGTWKSFSNDQMKSFINEVFLTAQEVRPELCAVALRHLASVMVEFDVSRAVWVYDQAFKAAQLAPRTDKAAPEDHLERDIILEEATVDLSHAVDHALLLSPDPSPDQPDASPENEKLNLLTDLIRRVPVEDSNDLFPKIAPALVREDDYFDQTTALAQQYQKSLPERARLLFSEALLEFQQRPADERLLQSFSSLTGIVAPNQPALAETGIDLLLKKADELDAKESAGSTSSTGLSNTSDNSLGRFHLQVLHQLYPAVQKINPAKAGDWLTLLRNQRSSQNLNPVAPPTFRSPATTTERQGNRRTTVSGNDSPAGSRQALGAAAGSGTGTRFQRNASNQSAVNLDRNSSMDQINLSMQPASAFSATLVSDLTKAQTNAKNDPGEFTRLIKDILPRVGAESDPRAQANALAQVSLAYFQLGDTAKGKQFLKESLAHARDGDSLMLKTSVSPSMFFAMYSATSNALSKVAPLYPQESIDAIRSISDPQLRLRAMVDNMHSLNILSSIKAMQNSQRR
jgi:hypothetical protein